MTEATLVEPEAVAEVEIDPSWTAPLNKALDRCDRCPSQAYVRTIIKVEDKNLELHWCAHHYNAFEAGLIVSSIYTHDERSKINEGSESASHV